MVGVFRDAVFIRQRMHVLPGRDSRQGLAVRRKQVPCKGEYLLGSAGIGVVIDCGIYPGCLPDMVYDVHHADFLPGC